MTDDTAGVSRRDLLRTAAGGAAVAAATGPAAAQEGGEPDFGGYLDDVGNFDGVEDATGQDEVTVEVGVEANGGAFGFGPAAVHVDNGATVVWEWTGEGGQHNVVSEDGAFESDLVQEAGHTFEQTFEEDGIYNYYCDPHRSLGMKGSVVVGEDFPTAGGGGGGGEGGGGGPTMPDSAKSIGVATAVVMAATLGFAYFFIKFGGDYETAQ